MAITVSEQTIAITAAALCGLLSGLLYDLLRLIRCEGGKVTGIVCDILFCLFCSFSLFLVGMAFGGGRSGIWEGVGFLVSFGLYLAGISPSITPFFGILRKKLADLLKKVQEK